MPPDYAALEHDITHVQGDDILLNWRHVLGERSDWTALVYFDQTERHWTQYGFGENQNTFNADYQYRCPLGSRNELICGGGYRLVQCDTYSSNPDVFLDPPDRSDNIYSCFVQDQFTVCEDLLFLTVGSKFERDDFTGFEWEPSIRLLMTPNKKYSLWASVSRAVRIPSFGEEAVRLCPRPTPAKGFPSTPSLAGNPNLLSEEMIAYEAGVRGQPTEKLSWDLAVFSNNYDRLTMPVPGTVPEQMGPIVICPLTVENAIKADTLRLRTGRQLQGQSRLATPALLFQLRHARRPAAEYRECRARCRPGAAEPRLRPIVLRPGASLGTGPDRPLLRRAGTHRGPQVSRRRRPPGLASQPQPGTGRRRTQPV